MSATEPEAPAAPCHMENPFSSSSKNNAFRRENRRDPHCGEISFSGENILIIFEESAKVLFILKPYT
jgi:hypothetical protein